MAASVESTSSVITTMDDSGLQHFPFNIYAGTVNGSIKGIKLDKQSTYNLIKSECARRSLAEITCMCWWNDNESFILTGRRDGSIIYYVPEYRSTSQLPVENLSDSSTLKVIKSHEKIVATGFSNGSLKCYRFFEEPPEPVEQSAYTKKESGTISSSSVTLFEDKSYPLININSGKNLCCMDCNASYPNLYATGGKENSLKIWDINQDSVHHPIFTAKNVKNDWLNLSVPVWETQAEFLCQSKKIITGTGYCQIRLYDPATPQRRPVVEIQAEFDKKKYPITALSVRPNSDFQLIFGTTTGNLALADLRKKSIVKHFKGTAGGITDIKFHPEHSVFASCGLNGYVQCYDIEAQQKMTHSIYMRSPVNCLLFSSQQSPSDYKNKEQYALPNTKSEQLQERQSSPFHHTCEDDNEDVWKDMKVVKTKKRKAISSKSVKSSKMKRESNI